MADFSGFAAGLGDILGASSDKDIAYAKGQQMGAQTESALAIARERVEKQRAGQRLYDSQVAAGVPAPLAQASRDALVAGGGLGDVVGLLLKNQEFNARQTASDPTKTFTERNIALQGQSPGPVERYGAAGEGMLQDKFSEAAPVVTPLGEATIRQRDAAANYSQQRADHPRGAYGVQDPAIQDALNAAVAEGRLDPARINSRNAPILGGILVATPGINLNRMIADASLQRNSTFQQRAMTMESIPTVMDSMVAAGKKIGFSDNRTIGNMQAWMKGEFNDPDYQEYMTTRNDALMTIANVMRGVGMSDQAHRAEIEAASPSMSPAALDAWLRGQMHSLQPRLEQTRRVTNLGETAAAPTAVSPAAAPAGAGWSIRPVPSGQ